MGWNGSGNGNADGGATRRPAKRSSNGAARGLVAGLVVVAGAAVCWLLLTGREEPQPERPDKGERGLIGEVTPAAAPTNAAAPRRVRLAEMSREEKIRYYREKFGNDMPEGLKRELYYLENPPQRKFRPKGQTDFLRYPAERQIAGVVLQEPGTYFVIRPEFTESFNDQFAESLDVPIEINRDDPEEVRLVKEAMIDLKREIADICKREGRKPNEVLNEYAKSMYDLGQYQRELEGELVRIHDNPEMSDADVEDFCRAANRMLEEKGLKPLPIPDLTRRSIRLNHAAKRAAARAARAVERQDGK